MASLQWEGGVRGLFFLLLIVCKSLNMYEFFFLCCLHMRELFFSNRNVSGQHIKQGRNLMFGNSRHCQAGNWVIGPIKMFKVHNL